MVEDKQLTGIKQWSEEDRPREKLLEKGRRSLSEVELIAILLNSGNKRESAVDLAKRILAAAGNNLHELAKWEVHDFLKFHGIGEAKALYIIAALELGRRRKESEAPKRLKLSSSQEVVDLIQPQFSDLRVEELWVLYLDRASQLIKKEQLSRGGITGTVVDNKVILKAAIQLYANSMILCHNHPSGNLKPSESDIHITKKLKEAGKLLDIQLVDHLIITDHGYFSFSDEGIL